jgi:hypothetical protein
MLPPEDQGTETATIEVVVLPWRKRIWGEVVSLLTDNWKPIVGFCVPGGAGALWVGAWLKKREDEQDEEIEEKKLRELVTRARIPVRRRGRPPL